MKLIPVLMVLLLFSCAKDQGNTDSLDTKAEVRACGMNDIELLSDLSDCEAFEITHLTTTEIVFELSPQLANAGPNCLDISFIPPDCRIEHNYTSGYGTSGPQTQVIVSLDPCNVIQCSGDDVIFICFDSTCPDIADLLKECIGQDGTGVGAGSLPPALANCIAFQL